jgi:hypothetical protein
VVIRLHQEARSLLGGEGRLETVQGVGHRLEEPRALERIAALTRDWFLAHLSATG